MLWTVFTLLPLLLPNILMVVVTWIESNRVYLDLLKELMARL